MKTWVEDRIKVDQITKYLDADNDKGFIDDAVIEQKLLDNNTGDDPKRVADIINKAMTIETLSPDETAYLLNVKDPQLWAQMEQAGGKIKKKVYDNRIVTFAPLYLGNYCVNNCAYCGFRGENANEKRRVLTTDEIIKETEVLAGKIGHKRLIVVYGEHPKTDADYIASSIETIGSVKVKARKGYGSINRCNINAAPMSIEELKMLHEVGIGTYQVFQETYHHPTYKAMHPKGTLKGNYLWRLYSMHRSMEAGCDDVGLGVLFGLYDWRFEVMGLLYHSIELENKFGIGPHTISFPRMEPADNTPFTTKSRYQVSDEDFRKIVTVIRLAVPHTGMIVTARENAQMRRDVIPIGCTQLDASSRIDIGGYASLRDETQPGDKQQFILGDTRSLDTVVRELAQDGYITSFCTAGYRCGRTGECIMNLLRTGQEGHFCKLNAVITFREWLDDFASDATIAAGEKIIASEIEEIKQKLPGMYPEFIKNYKKTVNGERDIYF